MTAPTDKRSVKRARSAGLDQGLAEVTGVLDPEQQPEEVEPSDERPLGHRSATTGAATAPRTLWERIESTFRLLSLIAIAGSAGVSALNFYQGYLDTKKDRSIKLMSDWHKTGARDTYAELGNVLTPAIDAAGEVPANLPERARQLARKQIGANLLEALKAGDEETFKEFQARIDTVVVFFSEIEFCLRGNLCNAPLLEDYFGTEVTLFWDYFQAYALDQRAGLYPTYGDSVEALAISFRVP